MRQGEATAVMLNGGGATVCDNGGSTVRVLSSTVQQLNVFVFVFVFGGRKEIPKGY